MGSIERLNRNGEESFVNKTLWSFNLIKPLQFMNSLFIVLLLVSVVALIVGLTKPETVKLKTRKKVGLYFGSAIIVLFFLVGVTADNKTENNTATVPETNTVSETASNTPVSKPAEKAPVQKSQPAQEVTQTQAPVVQPVVSKSYQQVFSFSGNGAKKSEPFTINGDRFKIKYNCSGELCQAFLYSTNNNEMSSIIMNGTGPLNDETIIYGSGQYYIDSNSLGNYTMTVEDYK